MITCDLRGQLANQCFIISTVIAHSLRTGVPYALPETSGKWKQFPMMFDHLPRFLSPIRDSYYYREQKFGVYNPLPEPIDGNLHIQGYFQSFRYFREFKWEILNALKLYPWPVGFAKEPYKEYVSIHVRRGDSLNFMKKLPQPTDKYFWQALEIFGDSYKFVVFSDDIPYCREYFKKFDKYDFIFCEESDAKTAMVLMSEMDHNIIVNSTFSLFASWMNRNVNKVVVSPSKENWFGEAYRDRLSAQDMIPPNYAQITY